MSWFQSRRDEFTPTPLEIEPTQWVPRRVHERGTSFWGRRLCVCARERESYYYWVEREFWRSAADRYMRSISRFFFAFVLCIGRSCWGRRRRSVLSVCIALHWEHWGDVGGLLMALITLKSCGRPVESLTSFKKWFYLWHLCDILTLYTLFLFLLAKL